MSEILSEIEVTDLVPEGRHGRHDGAPGVTAQVLTGLALATVVARKGAVGRISAGAMGSFGIALADAPKVSFLGDLSFIGTGPGRWLAAKGGSSDFLLTHLHEAFGDSAAIADQSDGNLVLDIFGPRVVDTLIKLVSVDLHPSVFGPGDAATTSVALIPLLFWQLNDSPAYRFAVPRSFGPAFLRALTASAAEFGCEIRGTGRG